MENASALNCDIKATVSDRIVNESISSLFRPVSAYLDMSGVNPKNGEDCLTAASNYATLRL
jgi:hypothetical protein